MERFPCCEADTQLELEVTRKSPSLQASWLKCCVP